MEMNLFDDLPVGTIDDFISEEQTAWDKTEII